MKRWLCGGLCALFLLTGGGALAQNVSVRRADGVGGCVAMWEKSNGNKYLFLPAYMRGQTLVLEHEGGCGVYLGQMELACGAATDAVSGGETLTMRTDEGSASIAVMQSANLPAVHLTTQSDSLDYIHAKKGNKEAGSLMIVTADGRQDYAGALKHVKGHGNATFVYEKKSYQIKLEDKAALLGMEPGKTYVLLANQHENSLIRNRMTMDLARAAGLRFTPECRSVDLYVNGEYRGNYLLCDKVTISSGCVDILDSEAEIELANEELFARGVTPGAYGVSKYAKGTHKGVAWPGEPEDVTGGFLFELEYTMRYKDEVSGVVTQRGQPIVVKCPEEMTRAQGEYAAKLLNSFERAIFAGNGVDERTGRHYTQIADMNSLVAKYMIEEISKNFDGNKSSQYFYKDSDSVDPLLYAGPVWDYDSAWGNYARENNLSAASPKGLGVVGKGGAEYSWWPALCRQDDFLAAVSAAYADTFRPLLLVLAGDAPAPQGCALGSLDDYARELAASADMNFVRWRVLNHESRAVKTGATYEENINYLRRFIRERTAYLDGQW